MSGSVCILPDTGLATAVLQAAVRQYDGERRRNVRTAVERGDSFVLKVGGVQFSFTAGQVREALDAPDPGRLTLL